jgi:hypothetical protein
MANAAAVKFIKQLVAAFSRYPTTQETKELYSQKLSKWHLTQEQWDQALDVLISHESDSLPPLKDIYIALKNAQYTGAQHNSMALGWLSFRVGCLDYVMRVISDGSVWLIAPMNYRDAHGQLVAIQQNVGQPAAMHTPEGATNILVTPDNPARPDPSELPTAAERKQYIADMEIKLSRMKSL